MPKNIKILTKARPLRRTRLSKEREMSMGKFRMIFCCEGPFESNESKKELEADSILLAEKQAENTIEEMKKAHPLFDFGLLRVEYKYS